MKTAAGVLLALNCVLSEDKPGSPDERYFGTDSFIPDWRAAEEADAKAAERFLRDYWPGLKGAYDTGGTVAPQGVTAAQKAAGAVVFTLPYTREVLPDYLPSSAETEFKSIALFAARGESEPFVLAVRTLDSAKEVSVEVGDLVGPAGTLSGLEVTQRLCLPYVSKEPAGGGKMRPMVLLKTPNNKWTFPPHTTLGHVVDVHVPAAAKAGTYKGKLTVRAGKAVAKEVALEVVVLPFTLKTNNFYAGGFGVTYGIWEGGFTGYYPEMIEIDSRYGFNLAGGFFNKGAEIPFRRTSDGGLEVDAGHEKFRTFNATMSALKKHGMGQVAFWNWGASGTLAQFNNVLAAAGVPPIGTEEGKKGFAQVCKAIKQAERKLGWPEFVINPVDEALMDQDATRELIRAVPHVQALSPETRLYMTEWHEGYTRLYQSSGSTLRGRRRPADNAPVAGGEKPRLNFQVIGANTLSQNGRCLQEQLGGEYWVYTTLTKVGPHGRFAYGFMPYIVKAEACLMWATWKGDLTGQGWTLHYLMPDEPKGNSGTRGPALASVRAVLAREGIDDRKYIETLKYHARTRKSEQDLRYLDELPARCRSLADDLKNIGGGDNTEAKVSDDDGIQKLRVEVKDRILKLIARSSNK